MAKRRAKILETRIFGFIIAAVVVAVILAIGSATPILDNLESKVIDTHFRLKLDPQRTAVQEGSVYSEQNAQISPDILIVGIDFASLTKYGKWPFDRTKHADLVNAFARIKDQDNRESALLLDILFPDPDQDPKVDDILAGAIAKSGRIFLETQLKAEPNETATAEDFAARARLISDRLGTLTNVKGNWRGMLDFLSVEPPLAEYGQAIAGYGHANFVPDEDTIFRRQPLVARVSDLLEVLKLDSLAPGYSVDASGFERLAWMDKNGDAHDIATPLTAASLAALKRSMERDAPVKIEAGEGDAAPGAGYYIVRKYRDRFVPAITLSLAANYFGKKLSDLEVEIGKRIRIPSPTKFDPDTGERAPYSIQTSPDQYGPDGSLVKEGARRPVDHIDIPIDSNGAMLVNFMGRPSSDSAGGLQTYPIRSYAAYADRAPGDDPQTWRRTMAVGNKIIMVGAFSSGMAADQKTTPLGLMYGIEVHANALNTIIMDNFLRKVPRWLDALILAALVFIVAFMSSRLSTPISFAGTLVLLAASFFAASQVFDVNAILVNYSSPALAMVFTFLSIVVYRAMTEERDKKAIRETFGKYVSPKVVDQLVQDPPELGGVDKELTVMFSDIRGFTSLSERMTPQELINHLNVYLTAMTDIILEYGGTLDKYIGDAIMAFWGAPLRQDDHAERACMCALRQMERLRDLNAGWPEPLRINIGIGLNSGIMTVGNMGSPTRMNYTLAGDNVNLGSRLEGTNKEYGTNIIVSESTYGAAHDKFLFRELDNIRVKGKNKPVGIYELIDCLGELAPPALDAKGKGRHAGK
jgi:adenylate cyclase